jgi:hypothetical protein
LTLLTAFDITHHQETTSSPSNLKTTNLHQPSPVSEPTTNQRIAKSLKPAYQTQNLNNLASVLLRVLLIAGLRLRLCVVWQVIGHRSYPKHRQSINELSHENNDVHPILVTKTNMCLYRHISRRVIFNQLLLKH